MSTSENKIDIKNFWYVACQLKEVRPGIPLSRKVLGEWLVLFKNNEGEIKAFQDRCPHRNFKLSKGFVKEGCLVCPYHGWTMDGDGSVVHIPAEGPNQKKVKGREATTYKVMVQDDLVYVCLDYKKELSLKPHPMPFYGQPGYKTVRLFNIFKNNVTNCAENYVDVPHTVFVHDKIFRVSKQEKINATVKRENGIVEIEYFNETDNLGWFSWFLNPSKAPIIHIDRFLGPNMTSVEYRFGNKEFYISSHCTPVTDDETYVYTDLTFKFGWMNPFAAPIVGFQGQAVIDQDIEVLDTQMEVIKKYGEDFKNSTADIVHVLIESVRNEIAKGKDPRLLPERSIDFEFWV